MLKVVLNAFTPVYVYRRPEQSKRIAITCHLYRIEVYTFLQQTSKDFRFTNIAMKYNGDARWSAPIPTGLLFWNRPGE